MLNSSLASERVGAIHSLVVNESIENVEAFVEALRSGDVRLDSRNRELQRVLTGPAETVMTFRKVLELWPDKDGASASQLADAVEVASLSVRQITQMPRAELVWTGPAVGHPTARKTYQVLNEMLRHATSKILIVGYSLFLGGDLARELFTNLAKLSSNGVRIHFIVDRRYRGWGHDGEEGHSVRQIQQAWPSNSPRPTVYSWTSEEDESSKLHAKLVLVDDHDLLVTSANLTGAGMETNLELGLRLQGETARSCAEHFGSLLAVNFFDVEPWP